MPLALGFASRGLRREYGMFWMLSLAAVIGIVDACMVFRDDRKRLGDLIAGTNVMCRTE